MKKLFAALVLSLLGACMPLAAHALTNVVVDCPLGYHVQTGTTNCVPNAQRPTCQLIAAGISPGVGVTVNLTWRTTNATQGTITTIGSVGPQGTQGVIPLAPATTYTGTFWGAGGTTTCQVTIPVSGTGGGPGANTGGLTSGTPSVGDGLYNVPSYGGTAPPPLNVPSNTTSGTNLSNSGGTQSSGSGLVTCGNDPANSCNLCTFGSTFQQVLNFAVGVSIPLAAMAFAFAGWLYFSNRENTTQIARAHKIFWSVLVGFIIVLMAWLMIQTILKAVAPGYQSWNSWDCTNLNRKTTGQISDVLNGALGVPTQAPIKVVNPVTFNPGGSITGSGITCESDGSCYSGGVLLNGQGSGVSCDETLGCYNADGTAVSTGGGISSTHLSNSEFGALLQNSCINNSMDSQACDVASAISLNESSGGKNCKTSNTGAVGCMQVLSTTACSLDSSIPGCGTCRNSARAGCADVANYISDPQINTNLGVQYINQLYQQYHGDCSLTAAAYFQGPGAVQKYGGVPPNAVGYVRKACG